MTTPTAEASKVEQDYHYQVDQQVSVNAFIEVPILDEVVKFQITSRYGSTPEKIVRTTEAAILAYQKLRGDYPLPERTVPSPSVPNEPIRQLIDDNGNNLPEVKTFTADKLSVSMNDGKYYFKVVGKPFSQYGVPVWDEVLKEAKLDVTPGQPVPDIAGWRADYIETMKDGKKRLKVTRLLPPK